MAIVTRNRIADRVQRLASAINNADVRKITMRPAGYETIVPKVVTGPDFLIDPKELKLLKKKLTKSDAALVGAAHRATRVDDTASTVSLKGTLHRGAYTLLQLPTDGNGIARSQVYTPSGKPRSGIGNVAAKLWTAVRRG